MVNSKIESLAYRLEDLTSLRSIFSELNFDFIDEPVNEESWKDEEKEVIENARIIAKKDDYKIYYLQTKTDSLKHWKGISTKIIKENHGLCLICSHNPGGFKWIFSSLSKEFSKSFSETRHIPVDINPNSGVPTTFVDFLDKLYATTDDTTTSIVTKVSGAFDSFAVEIHDELTVNVFEALKKLSEGIIGDKKNKLTLDYETLEEIREPIFILLYRIIFILYAEDRGIFPIENKTYHEDFSLKWIKEEWLLKNDNYKKIDEYEVETRLKKLFRLIEVGSEELDYNKDEFFMRSYYGRIFDRKINHEIEEWKIPNKEFLKTLSFITRTLDKKGNYFFLDYSALETRHLGSIYEKLLEFHLEVKNKKIKELPSLKDRKKSASYFTPEYMVSNIVKNSIEPLISSIIKKNSNVQNQIERILSLKILDPAMGSGHFLVGTAEYLAKRICQIEFGDENIPEQSYIERKREVVRKCIYGVDLNPLAVDLAKLSLWLETLSSDKPLSFLSAHLKCGNSLLGTEIETIFDKQTTLFESTKGKGNFRKNIKKFLIFEDLEDDSPSIVKMKLEEYAKMQSNGTIYYDIKFLLDCKLSEYYGIQVPNLGDYRAKIGENSLDFYTSEIFQNVKKISDTSKFFHWELEFPQIFFDHNGERKINCGFDVIIGNPPWNSKITEVESKRLAKKVGWSEKNVNISAVFVNESLGKLEKNGICALLLPKVVIKNQTYTPIRQKIIKNYFLDQIIDFGKFPKVASDAVAWIIQKRQNDNATKIFSYDNNKIILINSLDSKLFLKNSLCVYSLFLTAERQKLIEHIKNVGISLFPNYCFVQRGIEVGQQSNIVRCQKCGKHNEADSKYYSNSIKKCAKCKTNLKLDKKFCISSKNKDNQYSEKCTAGTQIQKYQITGNYFIPSSLDGISYKNKAFSGNKILLKRVSSKLEGTFTDEELFAFNTVYSLYNDSLKKSDFFILLAILNSSLMNFYYEISYNLGMKLTTQVTIDFLKTIPIKFPEDQKIRNEIIINVEKILSLNLQTTSNDTMENLVKKLDYLVYDTYELTPDQIEIISKS